MLQVCMCWKPLYKGVYKKINNIVKKCNKFYVFILQYEKTYVTLMLQTLHKLI